MSRAREAMSGPTDEVHANSIRSNATNTINGTDRMDNLNGTAGNDSIWGNGGNDYLRGGAGNDVLSGDKGNDLLWGGAGDDLFLFYDLSQRGDQIRDFQDGQDMIRLNSDGFGNISIEDVNVEYNLHHDRAIITVDGTPFKLVVLGQGLDFDGSDFSIIN